MVQPLKKSPEDLRRDLSSLRIERDRNDEGRPPVLRYVILGTVAVLLIGAVAAVAYRVLNSTSRLPEVGIAHANVESANSSYEVLTATGYVVAHRKAAVSPKISGRLEYMGVDVGSFVKANQVLARLEHHDLDAQLMDARATLATAQASLEQGKATQGQAVAALAQANATEHQTNLDFQRQTALLKDGVASKSDFDNAEAKQKVALAQVNQAIAQKSSADAQVSSANSQIRSAEAKITAAETQLEYTNIRSPFDGVVISKDAEVGESVAPAIFGGGATRGSVVTIVDPKTLEVEADVNESNIIKIEKDMPSEITLDAMPGKKFKAVAYQIVPTADRQKATVKVKVRFIDLDPRVVPDMSAKVAFLKSAGSQHASSTPRITVPKSAIQQRDGKTVVGLLDGDHVRIQPVKTGEDIGDRVEITEGLVGGETVIVSGLQDLRDGARVTVKTS